MKRVVEGFALAGGFVLLAVAALTVVSVIGRTVFGPSVPGDFELVELGSAVAVFAFLPYCQMRGGNVAVELLTRRATGAARDWIGAVHGIVFAVVAALIAWRMTLGGLDFLASGETSMILGVPRWWAFLPMVASTALLVVVCICKAAAALRGAGQ